MSSKDLHNVLYSWAESYPRRSYTFPHKPITSKESCWSPIERIPEHGTLLYRPFRQYCQSATEYAAVVELPIRQNMFSFLPNALIILLCPAFLQSNNVWLRICRSYAFPDFSQPFVPELGQVLETPAVESDHIDLSGTLSRRIHRYIKVRRRLCVLCNGVQ